MLVYQAWRWPQVIFLSLGVLGGCTTPHGRLDAEAAGMGFDRQLVRGDRFDLVVYRSWRSEQQVRRLHVYLEGDGTPWRTRTQVSQDPTPRNPVALALMARDPMPALYLGRPCYNGLARSAGCHPALWTIQRYGPEVVGSMAVALSTLLARIPEAELVFIGHSGGGTLAMLLAERFSQTRAVITIAGNLDVSRWAAHHRYTPLAGSLDPATRQALPDGITQIHCIGGQDATVPPQLTRSFVQNKASNAVLIQHDDFGHHCCWASAWPAILGQSERILTVEHER